MKRWPRRTSGLVDAQGKAEVPVLDDERVGAGPHPVRAVRCGLVPRAGARDRGAGGQLGEAERWTIDDLAAGALGCPPSPISRRSAGSPRCP